MDLHTDKISLDQNCFPGLIALAPNDKDTFKPNIEYNIPLYLPVMQKAFKKAFMILEDEEVLSIEFDLS